MSGDLDIYAAQGFAQTMGIGQSPALVIVDFVVGFTDPAHFADGLSYQTFGARAARLAIQKTAAFLPRPHRLARGGEAGFG
jgi:hypothetical protein